MKSLDPTDCKELQPLIQTMTSNNPNTQTVPAEILRMISAVMNHSNGPREIGLPNIILSDVTMQPQSLPFAHEKIELVKQFKRNHEKFVKQMLGLLKFEKNIDKTITDLGINVFDNPDCNVVCKTECIESEKKSDSDLQSQTDEQEEFETHEYSKILLSIKEESKKRKIEEDPDNTDDQNLSSDTVGVEKRSKKRKISCSKFNHSDRCMENKLKNVRAQIQKTKTSEETLESLEYSFNLFLDLQKRRKEERQKFVQYKSMLSERQKNHEKMYSALKQLMLDSYIDELRKEMDKEGLHKKIDKSKHEGKHCLICHDENPDCGLRGVGCECGTIAHMKCLAEMCFSKRIESKGHKICCPQCSKTFSEKNIIRTHC